MKFFSSELGQDYGTYTFGYANYGLLEAGDKLADMYERGYLPYSGSPESKGLFYMARSGRIHLPTFELDSECRRVAKKFDGAYTREVRPFKDFAVTEEFITFWLDYFKRVHGPAVMPRKRFESVLDFGIISHIGVYTNAGSVGGYTLEVADDTMTHDWYQAWAPDLDKSSFGVWLLIDIARAAKARGASYYYPGTVYGAGNYKTNLPGLEYWNGGAWVEGGIDAHTKTDKERTIPLLDEWKKNHPLF